MTGITLLVSIFFTVIALRSKPGVALSMVIISGLVWPGYLRIPMGLAQMSAPRIVALALLVSYLLAPGKRRFNLNRMDYIVISLFIWTVLANIIAGAKFSTISTQIGDSMDTVLMYFVARICIQTRKDLIDMVMPLSLVVLYLGLMGIYEAVTYDSPYHQLIRYHQWMWVEKEPELRLGLLRARVSTSHYIYFGMAMLVLVGFVASLRGIARKHVRHWKVTYAALFVGGLGIFSSLSSGPIAGAFIFVVLTAYYYQPSLIRPSLWGLVAMCLVVEVASNRHFYELVDYFALSGTTAYYRTRLLEVAIANFGEYALAGTGGVRPDHWGMQIDGRGHVDLVNNYVLIAVESGFLGVILFFAIQIGAIRRAISIYRHGDKAAKIYGFTIGAVIIALMISSISVGLFNPALMISYMLYGAVHVRKTALEATSPERKSVGAENKNLSLT